MTRHLSLQYAQDELNEQYRKQQAVSQLLQNQLKVVQNITFEPKNTVQMQKLSMESLKVTEEELRNQLAKVMEDNECLRKQSQDHTRMFRREQAQRILAIRMLRLQLLTGGQVPDLPNPPSQSQNVGQKGNVVGPRKSKSVCQKDHTHTDTCVMIGNDDDGSELVDFDNDDFLKQFCTHASEENEQCDIHILRSQLDVQDASTDRSDIQHSSLNMASTSSNSHCFVSSRIPRAYVTVLS